MIEVASSKPSSSKPPVVSLDETAEELNLFLPFLVRGSAYPNVSFENLTT
jgi:hypothetical protein